VAFTIHAPKSRLLIPLFVFLVIVLAPFALLFSLVRIPFAKRRVAALNKIIASDWITRKKYIYINYDKSFPLAEFVERQLFPKFGNHIIFDKWSDASGEWTENEPDMYHRVTTILQDIAGDFDGESHLLIGIITPESPQLGQDMANITLFYESSEGHVNLDGQNISLEKAKKQIIAEINSGLQKWSDHANQ
jgi:hypothetical protein